jgi:hypothetical protein
MAAIKAGSAAQSAAADAADQARDSGNSIAVLDALQKELQQRQLMESNYNEAIRLTEQYYRLTPATPSGTIASPKGPGENPGADWATGAEVKWSPRFYEESKIYFKIPSSDNKEHYGGFENIPGAATLANGETVINPEIFQSAIDDNNPGDLAYLIHHEAFHFMELTHRGWDNPDEGEIRAYKESLATLDVFELDNPPQCLDKKYGCWRKTFNRQIADHIADLQGPKKNFAPMFPTDGLSDQYKGDFNNYESDEKRLVRQIQDLKPLAGVEERRIRDVSIRSALISVAKKACADPVGFSEDDLVELARLDPYVGGSHMHLTYEQVTHMDSLCEKPLFDYLSSQLAQGTFFTADAVRYDVQNRVGFPAQPAAVAPEAPPMPVPAAVIPEVSHDREWDALRAFAISACNGWANYSSAGPKAVLSLERAVYNKPHSTEYREWLRRDLSGCGWKVYNYLVDAVEKNNFDASDSSGAEKNIIDWVDWAASVDRDPVPVTQPVYQPAPDTHQRTNPQPPCPCPIVGGIRVCPACHYR